MRESFGVVSKVVELGSFVETNKDGVQLKFKITTIPEEIHEDVVNHMVTFFLPRAPINAHLKVKDDPSATEAARTLFRDIVKRGAAMVAIEERPGLLKDRILGASMTYIAYKAKPLISPENSEIYKNFLLARQVAADRANVYDGFGIDKYLASSGVSVNSKYQGFHISERLLESREPLCQHFGIKVTGSFCTAAISQYLSRKHGYQVAYEEEFSKFKRDDGKLFFEGLPGKFQFYVKTIVR